jgi:hypothetical protein
LSIVHLTSFHIFQNSNVKFEKRKNEYQILLQHRHFPFIKTMSFLHLFIVNKSGGLIHHRGLTPAAVAISSQIGTNEWLRIASTFHSLHAIAAEASPVRLPHGKNAGAYAPVNTLHTFVVRAVTRPKLLSNVETPV